MTVSIPIWCDWKPAPANRSIIRNSFQFLYGAIGRLESQGLIKLNIMFQFLYGAIGRRISSEILLRSAKFQFLYGAIGSCQPFAQGTHPLSFNSYMVRLEAHPYRYQCSSSTVSIPIWCDWKGCPFKHSDK